MALTEISIKRPVTTLMVFLIIITLGVAGWRYLPIDLLPPIEFPQVTIRTDYPNVGPEEIEKIITEPIEEALAGVPGVERTRSQSEEGQSDVTLDFARGTNLDEAANDVRAALDRISNRFPPEVAAPRLWKFDPNDSPIVVVGVSSTTWDLQELTLVLERDITKRFEQILGVGAISIWGGIDRQVKVELRRDRLNASSLSASDIQAALNAGNVNLPGGNVSSGVRENYVRTLGEFTNLDQIRETVVREIDNQPIRVGDVAEVSFGYEDLTRVVTIDGQPMLRFGVNKQSGANTIAVAAAIRSELARINAERDDVVLFVASDQSTFIQQSIDNVKQSALFGALLAITVLYVFLRRGASTFIIAVSIPISIIATFGLLYFNGLTLNQMSFGGLALGVGLVVDNAVVVLENITRHREAGRDPLTAARIGTKEVGGAIIASTLTTSVIFLPVVFMQTITGVLFQQLALVVVFALLCSLAVALTLVPMLASRLLTRPPTPNRESTHVPERGSGVTPDIPASSSRISLRRFFAALDQHYASLLARALKRRGLVLGTAGLLVVIGFSAVPMIPVELAPQTEADEIDVELEMADGTNVAVLNRTLKELDLKVRAITPPGTIKHFTTDIRDGNAEVELVMDPDSPISSTVLADRLREALDGQIAGAEIDVSAQSGLWVLRRLFSSGGSNEDVSLQIRGYDLDQAQAIAVTIRNNIETIPGVEGVRISRNAGRPQTDLHLDRTKLAQLGLSVRDVASAIQANVGGARAGSYRIGGEEFPIIVRLRPEDRQSTQSLSNIPIRLPGGEIIPVSSVIDARAAMGPPEINRVDGQRYTTVSANLTKGTPLGEAVETIRERLSGLSLPPGFSIYFGGEVEEQEKAAADFRFTLLIALILVYMVMAAQFERFLDPLIVLCSVPLAVIGVVPTLLLTGTTLNMQSLMGVVMLIGIVVNNAIVLVDYINLLRREEGLSAAAAVTQAAARRLRPILMTTLTTVLGLLPLALGIGAGAEIQAALARVVLGGLVASTAVTLLFIPALYLTSHALLDRWHAYRKAAPSGSPIRV
jgi:HAE1 family hydrophobic/amphiphilic exporter-1